MSASRQRVMLITGASSGIGAEVARQAASAGYRVVLAARSEDRLGELAAELGGDEQALAVACDVTQWAAQEQLTERALEAFGQIDVVFANAGFGAARGFLNESPDHWHSMVLTNVLGAAYTVRANFDALRRSGGHLVLTGSTAGLQALPGSVYAATKAAVHSLAESARMELRGTGVRVTLLSPGVTDTPFFDNPQADGLQPQDVAEELMHALGRPPHVDVSHVVVRPVEQRDG